MLCAAGVELSPRRDAVGADHVDGPAPRGAEPLGVVNLSDRRSGQPFTAGDQKLVAAIATQIGTAIQNARLVRASVEQQRLAHEMQLAHDLQMKLLPERRDRRARGDGRGARRSRRERRRRFLQSVPPVGGSKTGVMIGDVSGHGYQAALIMALAMSASAIHCADAPTIRARCSHALMSTLREELDDDRDVHLGVLRRGRSATQRMLRYANTGHPHAFVVARDGTTSSDSPRAIRRSAWPTQRAGDRSSAVERRRATARAVHRRHQRRAQPRRRAARRGARARHDPRASRRRRQRRSSTACSRCSTHTPATRRAATT